MRVVVFGAGGGIGGWICEAFDDTADIDLVGCVRRWASAVRLARRGVNLVQCDLDDGDNVARTLTGADVVVNATMLPPSREPALVENLYRAAAKAGVARFIQLSSAAVYGDLNGEVDEQVPPAPNGDYSRGKIEMESRLRNAFHNGAPQLFIFRPSIVYGPFCEAWTVRYARRIAIGRWRTLGAAGIGTCNLIHAHDLARYVIAAAAGGVERTGPHVLNLNGPDVVSWNEYIECFGNALSIDSRRTPNYAIFSANIIAGTAIRTSGKFVKEHFNALFRAITKSGGGMMEGAKSLGNLYPAADEAKLLRRKVRYVSTRSAHVLNYRSSISLDDGLRQSANWCSVHGLV